ncbi:hypothetical protein GUJ93_ZPchr0014g47219 [Zizania palustris]|uniref:BHLH domain-containing protein n=1 Tax=Zizania palustris TaxID=103762 RepID=A0A8J5TAU8_ZIZPA|nr:hypothetical protein GUJ93_ZPchr0014g47219 [Zizania palustris]
MQSASIQTIVCVPFMGGVLELGTTDSVSEEPNLVNRVGAHFWELPFPPSSTCLEEPMSSSPSPRTNETGGDADIVLAAEELVVHGAVAPEEERELGADDFVVVGCVPDDDDAANLERISMDIDELYYGLCEELDVVRSLEDDSGSWLVEPADHNAGSFQLVPAYSPDQAAPAPAPAPAAANHVVSRTSCFVAWKRSDSDEVAVQLVAGGEYSQRLLKKTVDGGARMSCTGRGSAARTEESSIKNHVISERRRREKLNDMFLVLKSMLPSIHKGDKASILAETIDYVKELKKRVKELESSSDEPSRRRPTETSCPGRRRHELAGKVSGGAKRIKPSSEGVGGARDDGDVERERRRRCVLPPSQNYGGPSNVTVTVADKEVLLEVQCRWKELLMTRVFDAIKSLSLDVISVQASSPDGLLELKIRANKFAESSGIVAPGMISEALRKAISS